MISERNLRFLAVLCMVVLFVAGIGIGFSVSRLFVDSDRRGPPPHRRPDMGPMLDRFSTELSLSPEQKQSVHQIMEEGRKAVDQVMEETRPRLMEIRKKLEERIAAILNPEQRKLHRKLLERGHGVPAKPAHPAHPGPHGGPPGAHPAYPGPHGAPPPHHRPPDHRP